MPLSESQILLIFGGVTVAYTMLGGLAGVVFTDVLQFGVFLVGNLIFFGLAARPQATARRQVVVSRLTTLLLFLFSALIAILFVKEMVGWFLFIN